MSKFGKKFLIICLCCIVGGGILYGLGMAFGGNNRFYYSLKHGYIDAGNWTEHVSDRAELPAFDSIDIKTDWSDVVIFEGDSFSIEYEDVVYADQTEGSYWKVENGCFIHDKMKQNKDGVVEVNLGFDLFFGQRSEYPVDTYIRLTVPRGTKLKDIRIKSGYGEINLSNLTLSDNLEMTTSTGDIKLDNISALKIISNNSFGKIKLTDTKSERVNIEHANGDIEFTDSSIDVIYVMNQFGDIKVTNCNSETGVFMLESGEFEAANYNLEKLQADTAFGSVNLKNCSMTSGIFYETNGNVVAEDISVKEKLESKSVFGDIRLKMKDGLAPYRYECSVKYGEIYIDGDEKGSKENGGRGTIPLILESENGDIEIE